MSLKIAVYLRSRHVSCWDINDLQIEKLRAMLPGCKVVNCADREEFLREIADSDVTVSWRYEQEWVEMAGRLKLIATPAAGKDYFSVELPEGVESWNGSFHGRLMGETALGMMLSHCRGIVPSAGLMRDSGSWPYQEMSSLMRRLSLCHVCILGFGNIGQWIGRYAKMLGARITGLRRSEMAAPDFFDGADKVLPVRALHEVLPEADFLVVCLPRAEDTDNIIGREELSLLPKKSVLINLGRGNAIDEVALAEHLSDSRIAAAYLDVYKEEPLEEASPLRKLANAHLMPHASAISPDYLDMFIEEFAPRLKKHFSL